MTSQAATVASRATSSHFDDIPTESRPVVCVFCGASTGASPAHAAAARDLAQAFHAHNIKLIFGGGSKGIMGEVAKTLVSLSGPSSVIGIIPWALLDLERDAAVNGVRRAPKELVKEETYGITIGVDDMHERKQLMAAHVYKGGPGSGFVALSGGYGTMEELMEMTTWHQLNKHSLPVVLYSVEDYWKGLLEWIGKAVQSGFVSEVCRGIVTEGKSGEEVVALLKNFVPADGRYKLQWQAREE